MRSTLLALLTSTLALGCGTSSNVDPVGLWSFNGTFGQGTCVAPGTPIAGRITVSGAPGSFSFAGLADQQVTATMTCSETQCAMDAFQTSTGSTASIEFKVVLAADGTITGTGSEIDSSNACSQPINNITGSLQ